MIKILINNQEFSKNLLSADFSIVHRVREYSGEFSLSVHKSLLPYLKPSVDIKVYLGEKLIYGGIVYEMDVLRIDQDRFRVKITGGEYTIMATRRTISGIINTEPDPSPGTGPGNEDLVPLPGEEPEGVDRNTTGGLVNRYLDKFLREEGISKGKIARGGTLAETDLEEWDTMSINDIYNSLGDITGDDWHIGPDRRLYFGETGYTSVNHVDPERELNEVNSSVEGSGFFNMEVNYTLTNYKNKVFIIGGDPDEEVPEENLNYDGDLKYFMQLDNEINYMSNLNSNSGVWGYVIRDTNITTLENAEKRATKELGKDGKLPIEITVSTFMDGFNPTDTLFVNLESWDINNQIFTVEEVETRVIGDRIIYVLKLVNKLNVEVRAEDFFGYMEKLVKEAKKRDTRVLQPLDPEYMGGGSKVIKDMPSLKRDLNIWMDMQKEDTIKIDSLGGVYQVEDSVTGGVGLQQADPNHRPIVIERDGFKWLDFDPTERGKYLNLGVDPTAGTHFVVYNQDSTGGYFSCPLGDDYRGLGNNLISFAGGVKDGFKLIMNGVGASFVNQMKVYNKNCFICSIPSTDSFERNTPKVKNIGMNMSNDPNHKSSNYFKGQIAELITFSRILTDVEIDKMVSYLSEKYNITA